MVLSGTKVVLSGSGLLLSGAAASAGVYCGVGGGSWSSSLAEVVSSSEAWCVTPARGDGMRVLELSVGEGNMMSYSGVQLEYVATGRVVSVSPASGAVTGGTVVTVAGEGYVAGHTMCRFGSGAGVQADVVSSIEARCTTVAGVVGSVPVSISTSYDPESGAAGMWLDVGLQYSYKATVVLRQVVPSVADMAGGSVVSVVTAAGVEDGAAMWC